MKTNKYLSNLNSTNINLYVDNTSKSIKRHSKIFDFITKGKLDKILNYITIDDYCIGGTAALIGGYHIPIPREEIKDIDVIVPAGTIRRIDRLIKEDPFFKVVNHNTLVHHQMYDDSLYNEHLEFRCAEGPAIDLVEREIASTWSYYYTSKGCPLCPLEEIINVKKKWCREKDINDLAFINAYFELFGYVGEEEQEQMQRDLSDSIAIEEMKECVPPAISKETKERCKKKIMETEYYTPEAMLDDVAEITGWDRSRLSFEGYKVVYK